MNSKQFGDYEQKRKTAYFFFLIILGKQKLSGIATETKSSSVPSACDVHRLGSKPVSRHCA